MIFGNFTDEEEMNLFILDVKKYYFRKSKIIRNYADTGRDIVEVERTYDYDEEEKIIELAEKYKAIFEGT